MKHVFLLTVLALGLFSCKNRCYECKLEQINGPDVLVFPNDTIYIDTVQTCNYRWVKENNVPAGEFYPQSWRCEALN